jgi:hypothetical protein
MHMRRALQHHPDSPSAAVSQIDVDVAREHDTLALRYIVTGNIGAIRIPPRAAPTRTDELWRHTCFEVFVRIPPPLTGGGQGAGALPAQPYREFNFSPSTQWAAYSFTSHRKGWAPLEIANPPNIQSRTKDTMFELAVALDLSALAPQPNAPLTLGLSVVIEETNGAMSYWALTHPKGKADFHHSDCFALSL